jgi:streptogramin lyase
MRLKLVGLSLIGGLLLTIAVLVHASSLNYEHTDLTPYGDPYDIFAANDGSLYVSDKDAWEVVKFNPDGITYTKYIALNTVLDAQPDASGDIWWTNGDIFFGRIDVHDTGVDTVTVTSWQVPIGHNLWGVAFDDQQRVWLSEFANATSKLYRFDPDYSLDATQLCTITLPSGSSYSYDLKYYNNQIWLVNWFEQHIYRLDPDSRETTWWEIADEASRAVNLDFDSQDRLWWADEGLGVLVSFDPDTSQMVSYTLPTAGDPQGIYVGEQMIWFTAEKPGIYGWLDPQTATSSARTLISDTLPSQMACTSWDQGLTEEGYYFEGTATWNTASTEPIVETGGWQIYQVAEPTAPKEWALYGITGANKKIWIVDRGNRQLLRLPESSKKQVFIPLVLRKP